MGAHKTKHGLGDTNNHESCTLAQLNALLSDATLTEGGGEFSKNHFYGLKTKPNATNPNYQVDIKAGECRSDDDTADIEVTSPLTVDITASGANGLDTGSEASSTWYYIWAIKNTTSGTVAGLLSTSATSPTMPSGYTKKRLVGAVRNDFNGNFLNFRMIGNGPDKRIYYDDPQRILSAGSATSWTDVDCSSYVPGISDWSLLAIYGKADQSSPTNYITVRKNGANNIQAVCYFPDDRYGGATHAEIEVDGSKKIEYELAASTGDGWIDVNGFIMEL